MQTLQAATVLWMMRIFILILEGYTILQKKKASLHIVTPIHCFKIANKKLLRGAVESDCIQKTRESYHANI
jgi:hypothetical protein